MVIEGDALKDATDNFSSVIGRGGFGVVYKGKYHHVDVAIKILNKVSS
jgi:serine/threonine protein kinase